MIILLTLFAIQRTPDAPWIDTHGHFGLRGDNAAACVREALERMDALKIKTTVVMPPPLEPDSRGAYDIEKLLDAIKGHEERFAVLAGGGSLSPMIFEAVRKGETTEAAKRAFRTKAEELLKKGAVGFGEMAAEHFSLSKDDDHHPYLSAPPDHPLFLLLADIAAEHGVPIDLHMEAIEREQPLPSRLKSPPNPKTLAPNIEAFERLLAHNRKATIVWCHAGWNNTPDRDAELVGRLLEAHPNLMMNFKIGPVDSDAASSPIEKGRGIKAAWLKLIEAHPDRFMMGADQFYTAEGERAIGPRSLEPTATFLAQLPESVRRRIGHDNAAELFGLK